MSEISGRIPTITTAQDIPVEHNRLVQIRLCCLAVFTFFICGGPLDERFCQVERVTIEPRLRVELGVPLYLVYSPGAPERPRVLPELLTIDGVIDALRDAAPASDTATTRRREAT